MTEGKLMTTPAIPALKPVSLIAFDSQFQGKLRHILEKLVSQARWKSWIGTEAVAANDALLFRHASRSKSLSSSYCNRIGGSIQPQTTKQPQEKEIMLILGPKSFCVRRERAEAIYGCCCSRKSEARAVSSLLHETGNRVAGTLESDSV